MDQPWIAVVDLAAEERDVVLDDAGVTAVLVTPHLLEYLSLRDDPARVLEQELQQPELGGGSDTRSPPRRTLCAAEIHLDVLEGEGRRFDLVGGGPGQDGAHPRDQLLEAEGLGEVVVGPQLEGSELVLQRVASGEEDDGRAVAATAHGSAHIETVQTWHRHVDQHELRAEVVSAHQGVVTVAGAHRIESGQSQCAHHDVAQTRPRPRARAPEPAAPAVPRCEAPFRHGPRKGSLAKGRRVAAVVSES